jgi:tetratricopeptide (TPR) repeat protein
MPADPTKWSDFYKNDLQEWMDRWPGFFILFFLAIIAVWAIFKFILDSSVWQQPLPSLYSGLVVVFVCSLVIWLFLRRVPSFGKNEVGILVALSVVDEKLDEELLKLFGRIEAAIQAENLTTRVGVRLAPKRLAPRKKEDAYALRDRCGANLIIWGNVDSGNIQSKKATVFLPINFSYILPLPPKDVIGIGQNIGALLQQKRWIITEHNNVLDRNYVAQNIEEMSFYIVGLGLYFFRDFDKASEILAKVLMKYKTRPIQSQDNATAVANILWIIHAVFNGKVKQLELWPGSSRRDQDILLAEKIISEIENIQMPEQALLVKAQVEFARGNLLGAKQLIADGIRVFPRDPAPRLNMAFMSYYEGDIVNGRKYIKEGLNANPLRIGDQLVLIALWYEKSLEEDSTKTYLHYPLGLLYFLQGNNSLARVCFEKVVQLYTGDSSKIAQKMIYDAQKHIKKIDRTGK